MSKRLRDKIVIPPDMDIETIRKILEDVEEVLYTQYYMEGRSPGSDGYWVVYKDKLRERLADLILLEGEDDTD